MAVPVPPPPAAVRAPFPAVVHHRDGRTAALVSVYAADGYVIVRAGDGATLRGDGADLVTLPWGPARSPAGAEGAARPGMAGPRPDAPKPSFPARLHAGLSGLAALLKGPSSAGARRGGAR